VFGFSRGAFTIRLFACMLYRCGVANVHPGGKLMKPDQIDQLAKDAVGAFKLRHTGADVSFRETYGLSSESIAAKCSEPDAWQRAAAEHDSDRLNGQGRVPIRFVGVWDTVDAVGLPFDNLAQFFLRIIRFITKLPGFSWMKIQLLLNLARQVPFFHKTGREWETWGDDDDLHPCIENACHAISIDDERMTFHPVLWLEYKSDGTHKVDCPDTLLSSVRQLWFSGVHANVGGGYPKDHLAYVSLEWMMRHARQADLVFNKYRWQDYH
jgi:uncharacterized protein (DUF2235 family)